MVLVFASLASGAVPNPKATLYTSVGTTAIKRITYTVTDGAAHTVNLYLKQAAGTSRALIPLNLTMDPTDATKAAMFKIDDEEMSAGDTIEGDDSVGTGVDYVITGATR